MNSLRSFIGYLSVGWCGHGCGKDATYGYVPEANCPIHDPDTRIHNLLSRVALKLRPLVIKETDVTREFLESFPCEVKFEIHYGQCSPVESECQRRINESLRRALHV